MLQQKRSIKAADVIRDLRSGMTACQLMEKYRISITGLRLIFRKLLDTGVITNDELNTQVALYKGTAGLSGIRKCLRTSNPFALRICDSSNPFATGYLLNISENGVCVKGVEAVVEENRAFVLRSDVLGGGHTLAFEGKCRWVDTDLLTETKWVTGFEITRISRLDSAELQNLIRHIQDVDFQRRINESIRATFGGI